MSQVQDKELEQVVIRALITGPNNMQEKTINGKTITVFEVQNFRKITDAISKHYLPISKVKEAVPKRTTVTEEMDEYDAGFAIGGNSVITEILTKLGLEE